MSNVSLLRFIVRSEKVDDGDVVLLSVAMASPDALLDALRVPRQIVIDHCVAKLKVQSLRTGLGGDEDTRDGLELMHQRHPHSHVPARLAQPQLLPVAERLGRAW
jgi:hypothetical protein